MKKKELVFILTMFLLNHVFAQTVQTEVSKEAFAKTDVDKKKSNLPSIGLGVGVISFYGDIGDTKAFTLSNGGFLGYNLNVMERLGPISFSLNAFKGKVSSNERSTTRNLNFESPLMDVSLNIFFHFDNDFILPKKSIIAPYLSVGLGYLSFKPMADLKDKNGNYYYYWAGGSIRDKPENAPDAASAKTLTRDYVYETALPAANDTTNNDNIKYAYSTLTIPVSAGIFFKLTPSFHINVGATYYITQTDWIDNVSSESKGIRKGNSANDKFLYSFIAVHYNLGARNKGEGNPSKSTVDFSSIENTDSDKDGIKDVSDNCPDTPPGTKVDSKGCPLDSDNDGIFDYLDKEPNTKKGKYVDANGVTLNDDSLVIEHEAAVRYDSTMKSSNYENSNPSGTSSLPEIYQEVDLNKDGKISTNEINSAIDNFFEGNTKLKIDGIYGLIDYFFEQ